MADGKRKHPSFRVLRSQRSHTSYISSTFVSIPTALDAPESPLSDYPDNLSECSDARADKRTKVHAAPTVLSTKSTQIIDPVSSSESSPNVETLPSPDSIRNNPEISPSIEGARNIELLPSPESTQVTETLPLTENIRNNGVFPPPETFQNTEIPPSPASLSLTKEIFPTPPELDFTELSILAQKLTAQCNHSGSYKPRPSSHPEVWAEGRQELCETLPYFRAYHGGGYSTEGYARGFMFDKSAHDRDYMDSTVVISRAGGGMVRNKDSGEMVLRGNQGETSQVKSLRNSMRYFNPVVIITGADNPKAPSKPPYAYNVLDYFKPTHIWSEKSQGKVFVRYRFEKFNPGKPSWWSPKDFEEQIILGALPPPVTLCCKICHQDTDQVYLQGWMCLHSPCSAFWKLPDGSEPEEAELLYDVRFLKQKTTWPNEGDIYPLAPSGVELSGLSIPGEDSSVALWGGMVCTDCGRCNSRLSWMGWECGNAACSFTRKPPHTLIPATTLREPFFPLSSSPTLSRDLHAPNIQLHVSFKHGYRINRFTIPGIDGFVAHLVANKPIVEESGGPNEMFEELQQNDIGLRRRPLGTGMIKGESYTRHFSVNYGMPYKFIAATASESFDGAASAITKTRTRLNWASKMMAQDAHQEFNEVLALGYFEEQRMNYHDDGEFGLGPTIATLSLGAPGTMRLRMKARHYLGVSKEGVYNDALPKPGCYNYEMRLASRTELENLKAAATGKDYRARLKTISKELNLKTGGTARDSITMTLGHGDIVIMHGAEIQQYYEHAVEHGGKLRFALTCRYIDPESLGEADKPKYEVKPDIRVYDGSRLDV